MRKIVMIRENIIHWCQIQRSTYELAHTLRAIFEGIVWDALCPMKNFSYRNLDMEGRCTMFFDLMTIFLIQDRWKGPRVYYVFRRTDFFLIHNSWKEQAMYSSLAQAGAIQTGFAIWPILDRIGCFAAPPAVVDSVFSQLIFIHDRTSQPFRSYFQ